MTNGITIQLNNIIVKVALYLATQIPGDRCGREFLCCSGYERCAYVSIIFHDNRGISCLTTNRKRQTFGRGLFEFGLLSVWEKGSRAAFALSSVFHCGIFSHCGLCCWTLPTLTPFLLY